jgi:hypothetical protein
MIWDEEHKNALLATRPEEREDSPGDAEGDEPAGQVVDVRPVCLSPCADPVTLTGLDGNKGSLLRCGQAVRFCPSSASSPTLLKSHPRLRLSQTRPPSALHLSSFPSAPSETRASSLRGATLSIGPAIATSPAALLPLPPPLIRYFASSNHRQPRSCGSAGKIALPIPTLRRTALPLPRRRAFVAVGLMSRSEMETGTLRSPSSAVAARTGLMSVSGSADASVL